MTFEPLNRPPWAEDTVTVMAEVEFDGRKLSAILVADKISQGYEAGRESARRELKRMILDEIGKALDIRYSIME